MVQRTIQGTCLSSEYQGIKGACRDLGPQPLAYVTVSNPGKTCGMKALGDGARAPALVHRA